MNPWRDLWSGDMAQAKFLDENLFTHVVLIGGSREELIRGREAWVTSPSAVDDLKASLDRLVSAGATMRLPPIPYPGVPQWRLAYLADPEGNLVELVSRR